MTNRCQLKFLGLSLLLANIGLAVLGADCVTAPPQLAAWWRAENNVMDSAGANHGIISGATFAHGRIGQAFSLDGVNDGISVPDATVLRPLTNLTIEGWIKTPGIAESTLGGFIVARSGNGFSGYELLIGTPSQGGRLRFTFNGGGGGADLFSTNSVTDDLFHHVAATYDGTTMRVYHDGACEAEQAMTQPISYVAGDALWIGRRALASIPGHFPGLIDELSIFHRALSSGEIAAIYSAGSAGKCVAPTLEISALPGAVRLSWTTNAPGFVLQETLSLSPTNWVSSASGSTNPIVVPATVPTKSYRLFKP